MSEEERSGDPAAPGDEAFVRIRGLRRTYHLGSENVAALDGIDLDIAAGELVAIVGVSGSGKSTLLHLLGGLDRPDAGSLRVDGREVAQLSRKERTRYRRTTVGFVFQSFHLVPTLSAEANVRLALTFQGVFGAPRKQAASEALARVGLAARAGHRPGELSGGEQQRVAVARALVGRPPLILADEPTGNLDRATAHEVMELLSELRREARATIVFVTHDEELARQHADRLVRLRDGRILEEVSACAPSS